MNRPPAHDGRPEHRRCRGSHVFVELLLFGTLFGALCAGAGAEEPGRPLPPTPPRWEVGAAAVFMQSPYLGQRGKIWVFPAIGYRGPRVYLYGPGGGIRIAQGGPLRADAVARVRFSPFNEKEGGALLGLKARPTTVEAGARISSFLPHGLRADATVTGDVLRRHSGVEAGAGLSRPFRWGAWAFIPAVRLQYWSAGLTDHYYGVRENERTPDRPAYSPGGAWIPAADGMVQRRIGKAWSVMANLGATRLGSGVGRSPIVERRTMLRLIASVTYAF